MNTTGKKGNKDFGLAAQLVRPRVQPIIKVRAEEENGDDSQGPVIPKNNIDQIITLDPKQNTLPQRENYGDFSTQNIDLSTRNRTQKEAEDKRTESRAYKRPPGRPRRAEKTNRMTLILSE